MIWIEKHGRGSGPDYLADLVSLNVATGERRVLVSRRKPFDPVLRGNQIYYGDEPMTDVPTSPDSFRPRDLFMVPADGSSAPRRLTHSGRVKYGVGGDGWLAWREEAVPRDEEGDHLWAMRNGRGPTLLGTACTGFMLGDGFVVWGSNLRRDTLIADLAKPDPVAIAIKEEEYSVVDGDRLVGAESEEANVGTTVIVVARVIRQ